MTDIINEQTEDETLEFEISDEALEAAAFAGKPAAYTEFAYCTRVACPGGINADVETATANQATTSRSPVVF
jgi:hypothetical protein